jgi:hypothetical protein
MLTEQSFRSYIKKLGYEPASTPMCVEKINKLSKEGQLNFDFYVNPHNLCWFADDKWKQYNMAFNKRADRLFTLNIRDFKLAELDII